MGLDLTLIMHLEVERFLPEELKSKPRALKALQQVFEENPQLAELSPRRKRPRSGTF
jgi:hypothetical protein